jgi:hypothetical protein
MKKSAFIQLLPVLILIGGILILSGCTDSIGVCKEGKQQLPAKWVEAKFPLLEGGSICTYNGDKNAHIKYRDIEFLELRDKYAEKFKSEGWQFGVAVNDKSVLSLSKDGKHFTLGFSDCSKLMSKCADLDVLGF